MNNHRFQFATIGYHKFLCMSNLIERSDFRLKCEKCGREMSTLMVNMFNHDGSDGFYTHTVEEEKGTVVIKTKKEWTGYELNEEEMVHTIACPYCREFPFKDEEIQMYEDVVIVCFPEQEQADGEKEKWFYKMCPNEEMAIFILDFIKRQYVKHHKDAGVQKYVEALEMGIQALEEKTRR